MKIIKTTFIFVILITFSLFANAQDPLSGRDLTNFKTEALSENQIAALQQKLKQSGMTIDQVQSQAISKGMSYEEFAKLKDRLNGISGIGLVMAKAVKKGNINTQASATNALKDKDTATVSLNTSINTLVLNFYRD